MTINTPDWFVDFLTRGYPDPEGFVEMAFSPEFTAAITQSGAYTDSVIYSIVIALTKFNCQVQFSGNHFAAELIEKKRYFERRKREAVLKLDTPKSTTEKAKLDLAYQQDPDLNKIEEDITSLERNVRLYDGMADRIQELIQIIKRELDRRNKFR